MRIVICYRSGARRELRNFSEEQARDTMRVLGKQVGGMLGDNPMILFELKDGPLLVNRAEIEQVFTEPETEA